MTLATYDTVEGRLRGDMGASLPFLYERFAARARRATPGTDVFYT